MNQRLWSAAIAAGVVVLDRISKLYIRSAYSSYDTTSIIPGFCNIVHTENPGAAFGMFSDSHSQWRSMLLVATSLVVMSIIGVMLWKPRRSPAPTFGLVSVGLSLVFGGALGNM